MGNGTILHKSHPFFPFILPVLIKFLTGSAKWKQTVHLADMSLLRPLKRMFLCRKWPKKVLHLPSSTLKKQEHATLSFTAMIGCIVRPFQEQPIIRDFQSVRAEGH